jgi:lipoate-protein ligase A
MLILAPATTNPYTNLATEEYLLKNSPSDIFMLWRSQPAVIVGKHQNAMAEINYHFVRENGIPVIRRLSGGGTVYHDLGNLNYTFIMNGTEGNLVNFRRFAQPIIDVLHGVGVDARLEGKNDLRVNGKKISGNAEHVYKNRVLHHGTLLVESNLVNLGMALKAPTNRYSDRAVQSIRSVVANLNDYLDRPVTADDMANRILGYMALLFPKSARYELSDSEQEGIGQLAKSKYSSWEWNFGYSPAYVVQNTIDTQMGVLRLEISVEMGVIRRLRITNSLGDELNIPGLAGCLTGCRHEFNEAARALRGVSSPIVDDPNRWANSLF